MVLAQAKVVQEAQEAAAEEEATITKEMHSMEVSVLLEAEGEAMVTLILMDVILLVMVVLVLEV
jgi:hypothetical protein